MLSLTWYLPGTISYDGMCYEQNGEVGLKLLIWFEQLNTHLFFLLVLVSDSKLFQGFHKIF